MSRSHYSLFHGEMMLSGEAFFAEGAEFDVGGLRMKVEGFCVGKMARNGKWVVVVNMSYMDVNEVDAQIKLDDITKGIGSGDFRILSKGHIF